MANEQQTRYFEFQDDKSAKFWEVTNNGTAVTVRYGKIGTNGQSQTKLLADVAAAAKHVAKLVAEKTGKGYVESGDSAVAQVASEPVPEATPAAPRKKAASAKKTAVTNPAKDPDASPESLLALLNKDDATNRLLARHPRAGADLLEKLSHSSDKATRQGVAANPNTPPETYVKLGQQFPKEFLANPALDLLLMVNPALMEEVPEALLVRLLKQADCPASLLTWAAGTSNSKVQLAVAMNANAPESARQRLGQSLDPAVREAVKPMAEAGPEQEPEQAFEQALRERIRSLRLYELEEGWESGDIGLAQWSALPLTFRLEVVTNRWTTFSPACVARVLRDSGRTLAEIQALLPNYTSWDDVAKHPITPVGVLEAMAKDAKAFVRLAVSENPSTPVPVLEALAMDTEAFVRHAVAENPSTPVPVLEALAMDTDHYVRIAVAVNPSTPVPVLESLAGDSERSIQIAVCKNPSYSAPISMLEALAMDTEHYVRIAVAVNPSAPVPVLEALAKDSEQEVRSAVAKNPSAPVPVLEILAKDKDNDDLIRKLAIRVRKNDELIRHTVAKNPAASASMLEIFSKYDDVWTRHAVACNPAIPVPVLETLARDSDSNVRRAVACNPAIPVPVLETLAWDSASDVRCAVAKHPSIAPTVLEMLSADGDSSVREAAIANPNTPLPALLKLVSTQAVGVRRALAAQSHRSPEILHSLWKDTDVYVRQAVASCPGLTQAQLDEMLQDCELETDLATLLVHPNLGVKGVEYIFEKLFTTPAADSAWFRRKLTKASAEIRAAAQSDQVTYYHGKNPNKAVLAKRALAPLMALCAGPFIEPARLVKVVGSTDWLVRAAVARNTGTPPNLIKKLSADAHPLVAALAKKLLNKEITSTYPKTDDYLINFNKVIKEIYDRLKKISSGRKPNDVVWWRLFTIFDILKEEEKVFFQLDEAFLNYARKELNEDEWVNLWKLCLGARKNEHKEDIAQSPFAPDFALSILAQDKSIIVKQNVASNQNTPANVLEILARDNDEQVRACVSRNTRTPASLLEVLSNDESLIVRKAAGTNPGTSVSVLAKLSVSEDAYVRVGVAENPSAPSNILESMVDDKYPAMQSALARNPNTPISIIEKLSGSEDSFTRREIAENPSTPISILESMVNDEHVHVRSFVACNSEITLSIIQQLANDRHEYVRGHIARNPNTPSAILELLSNDSDEKVRLVLARNPRISPFVAENLSNDKNVDVRMGITENPSTPYQVIELLAKDKDKYLRMKIAGNTSTPAAILEILSNDISDQVRERVAGNPNTPSSVLEKFVTDDIGVRESLATSPYTPALILEHLAKDTDDSVRFFVAENPRTPSSALEILSHDKEAYVRLGVARNPFTPNDILKILSHDIDTWVKNEALLNPMNDLFALGTPIHESYKQINNIVDINSESSFASLIDIFDNYQRLHFLRRAMEIAPILSKGKIPEFQDIDEKDLLRGIEMVGLATIYPDNKILTKASRSTDWLSRLGVALHPEATKAQLKLLCEDADPDVAAAARQRLQNAP